MNLKKTVSGIAFLLLIPIQSFAITGNETLKACENKDTRGMCTSYLAGIFEGMLLYDVFLEKSNVTTQPYLCIPSGVNKSQITDTALNYIRDNADIRHYETPFLVLKAVREKFPC